MEHLREGQVFIIKQFDVCKSGSLYKMTEHQFMIRFTEETSMKEVEDENHSITKEKFRIRSHDELKKLADKNEDLPDVIGFLCKIHRPRIVTTSGSKRLMLRIIMEEELIAYITIWNDLADYANEKLQNIKEKTIVIVATSINPKIFSSHLYLNTTSASKIFFNCEFDIEKGFRERMGIEHYFEENNNPLEITKLGKKCHSISEMLEFISNEKEQEKEFICIAKVLSILTTKGWNYVSCSKCSRKMGRVESKLKCFNCNTTQAIGVLRFRIEVVVDDGKDQATFVVFDKDVKQLTNKAASDLTTIHDIESGNAEANQSTPACIMSIVGRKFKFQVQVTPYNFRAKKQTFTVKGIIDEVLMTEKKEETNAAESSTSKGIPLQDIKIEQLSTDSEIEEQQMTKKRKLLRKISKKHIPEELIN